MNYTDNVLKAVPGSGAEDTWRARAVVAGEKLEAVAKRVADYGKPEDATEIRKVIPLLRTIGGVADRAINALGVYADESFFEEVKPATRAAEDRGSHARAVLYTIVPGAT